MEPTIGRIVYYNLNGRIYPAIITTVWSDTCVNLTIFTEERVATIPEGFNPVVVKTSIEQGVNADQWNWPERV